MTAPSQTGIDRIRQSLIDRDRRLQAGADPRVANWQCDLEQQLIRLEPYLVAGRIVTFARIAPEETEFFEELAATVRVPERVCAVFVPPSVVQRAMGSGSSASFEGEHGLYSIAPDAGALVAARCGRLSPIVNALFAFPPLTPGIDVYEDGRLLAGYTFDTPQACMDGLSDTLFTHLA